MEIKEKDLFDSFQWKNVWCMMVIVYWFRIERDKLNEYIKCKKIAPKG